MDLLANTDLPSGTVELVEFGDFGCLRCRQSRDVLSGILRTFDGLVTYTYRYFPARQNELSMLTAVAAEAARRQGYFWPMYNAIFKQPVISQSILSILALYVGLDYEQFHQDIQDEELRHYVETDRHEGHRLGVVTTPTFFINGQQFHGKLTHSRLAPILHRHVDCLSQPVLSKVDPATGAVNWGRGDWI
ncbi:DsbA family protein [Spirosoma spitsbergense]|uniref:DsbA family protein n=1 Tax=Spirosoma spitsbergense TaxID=431554 RepID=UPI000380D747|nr:thioredoxin domain-containing protein [Spirosoma spitsbergense]